MTNADLILVTRGRTAHRPRGALNTAMCGLIDRRAGVFTRAQVLVFLEPEGITWCLSPSCFNGKEPR